MSGDIITTIVAVLTIFGFMYAQTGRMTRGQEQLSSDMAAVNERLSTIAAVNERLSTELKEVRADIAAVNERLSSDIAAVNERLSTEFKEVRADIAAVNEHLSHTDGLVEGLSRALLRSNVA